MRSSRGSSYVSPRTSSSAARILGHRSSGNRAISAPSSVRSTMRIHSGLSTHALGKPSASPSVISHDRPLVTVDIGITGICDSEGKTSSRPSTRIGRRLSGASKRNHRMSPRRIKETPDRRLRLAPAAPKQPSAPTREQARRARAALRRRLRARREHAALRASVPGCRARLRSRERGRYAVVTCLQSTTRHRRGSHSGPAIPGSPPRQRRFFAARPSSSRPSSPSRARCVRKPSDRLAGSKSRRC